MTSVSPFDAMQILSSRNPAAPKAQHDPQYCWSLTGWTHVPHSVLASKVAGKAVSWGWSSWWPFLGLSQDGSQLSWSLTKFIMSFSAYATLELGTPATSAPIAPILLWSWLFVYPLNWLLSTFWGIHLEVAPVIWSFISWETMSRQLEAANKIAAESRVFEFICFFIININRS